MRSRLVVAIVLFAPSALDGGLVLTGYAKNHWLEAPLTAASVILDELQEASLDLVTLIVFGAVGVALGCGLCYAAVLAVVRRSVALAWLCSMALSPLLWAWSCFVLLSILCAHLPVGH